MWNALKAHFAKHALFWVIATGLGGQAFFTALYDNFYPIPPANMADLGWWQVASLLAKSLSFALGIVVGYLIKSPNGEKPEGTTPPFPSPAKP